MYATIRRYEGIDSTTENFAQAIRQIASILSQSPGFVSFVVIESQSSNIVTVSIFEDQVGLGKTDQLQGVSFTDHIGALPSSHTEVLTGEIVFQRGL